MNKVKLEVPVQLRSPSHAWPIIYVDTRRFELWHASEGVARLVGDMLGAVIERLHRGRVGNHVLLKVNVGEPNSVTRMRPEYTVGNSKILRTKGVSGIVVGDTTFIHSGPRGYKQNPPDRPSRYLHLAWKHGWARNSKAGIPFVVLDRPVTAKPEEFEFSQEQECFEIEGLSHFRKIYTAGGFAAADFIINHAHLTLHGLTGVAGCVNSIAMGCSGLKGKLQMHQPLLPYFDSKLCTSCGRCVESCPEEALRIVIEKRCPNVDPESCTGCGECEAVCAVQGPAAVKMSGEEKTNFTQNRGTLPVRMADYTIGLMNNKWNDVIHVLHMYAITERCDCVNTKQQPLLKRDLGFLVGKNPFAIDHLAARILGDALCEEGQTKYEKLLKSVDVMAAYVHENYGILDKVPLEKILLS